MTQEEYSNYSESDLKLWRALSGIACLDDARAEREAPLYATQKCGRLARHHRASAPLGTGQRTHWPMRSVKPCSSLRTITVFDPFSMQFHRRTARLLSNRNRIWNASTTILNTAVCAVTTSHEGRGDSKTYKNTGKVKEQQEDFNVPNTTSACLELERCL